MLQIDAIQAQFCTIQINQLSQKIVKTNFLRINIIDRSLTYYEWNTQR